MLEERGERLVELLPNNNVLFVLPGYGVYEIERSGKVVWSYLTRKISHEQNMHPANRDKPQAAVELDGVTGAVVWGFPMPFISYPLRDANRLPNGNTLITGSTMIVEVTPQRNVVWRLRLNRTIRPGPESAALGFYKAERIGTPTSP